MTVADTPIHLLIGPHRSGTSLLGQILYLLGMDIGRSVMLPSFDNPRGFWENQKVIHAHDGLLSALGVDWTTVDKLTPEWISSEVAHETGNALVDILEKDFDTERPALVKDPRLCVLLPLWQEISKTTNRPLKLLGIVRFPGAISNSLAARSNLLEGAADHVTQLYLQAFFKSLQPMQPAFVVFEKLIETPAKDVIDVLLNELNLPQGFERRHAEHVLTRLMSTNVSQRYKNNEDMKPYRQLMGKKVLLGSWPGLGKYLKDCPHHPLPEGPEGSVTELSSLLLKTNTVNTDGVTAERRSRPDELQIMSEKLDVLAAREAHLTGELDSANQRLKDTEVKYAKFRDLAETHFSQLEFEKSENLRKEAQCAEYRDLAETHFSQLEFEKSENLRKEAQCAEYRDLAETHFSQLEFEKSENLRKEAHLTGELDSANQRLKDTEVKYAKFRDLAETHFSQLEFEKSENLRKEAQCAEYRDLAETHFSQLEFEKSENLRKEAHLTGELDSANQRLKDTEVKYAKFRDLAETHFSQLEFEKSENLRKEAQCAEYRDLAETHFSQLKFEKSENLRKEAHLTGELDSANQRLKDIEVQCAEYRDLAETHFSQLEFEKSENLRKEAHLTGEWDSANRRLRDIEAQYTEYRNLAETHFSQLEFEKSRFLRMEMNMSFAISIMRKRLHYSRSEPVRAAVKTISLDAFQSLRQALPLPTGMKLLITRKMAGFAAQLDIYNTLGLIPESMPLTAVPWRGNNIDFAFLEEDHPVISIIVPVYNEIGQTISCLRSIHFQMVSVPYEVILADDHSPDESHTIFKEISGLRYFRNPENLGFLRNCNVNAARARGDYIVFLNNDTYVKQGWLQSLYSTYFEHGDVGIVGSKLIYPSGELQEAGGIVWEDASGWNWGRSQDPNHPRYNFVRDVDYVSGASLMIRTDLFREIGGFYEDLEKAYYEDTDCCFRVRERGYRVLYQPMSEVIHIESLSSGPDINTGMKRYQDINKDIFYNTWKDQLATHLPNAQSPEIASDRNVSGHILYIDSVTPEPDKDSGSLDAVNAFHILRGLGYRVHFVPGTNFAHWDTATKTLQKMGVECIYYPHYPNMKDLLKERGDTFDYIILSRLEIMQLFLKDVKRYCPSAKLIFNTVDLHHLRMERESVLLDDEKALKLARDVKKQELGFIKKSDATIVLSEHEKRLLSQNIDIKNKLFTIPLIRQKTSRLAHYNETRDIVFLGGYRHAPNVDAVDWMMKELWPVMQKTLPDVRLLICGSHIPERFQEYASGTVMVKGYIENLDALLSCTRLTLAPLRYGAGLKGKVATSIGAGVPCVGTEIAYEGMPTPGLDIVRLQAGNAKEFSKLATKVYFDPDQWEKISIAGVKYHNENFSMDAVTPAYENMLNAIAD